MLVITGSDGLARTPWAYANDRMRDYYDTEWGMPVTDERGLFERLSLEAFQAGLSWDVILRKRDDFRRVFHDFDPDRVAAFTDADVENALADAGIVRNRAKISATVGNARAVGKLRGEEFPLHPRLGTIPAGLPQLIWSHLPERTPEPATSADVPTTSAESTALAKALKKRGFRFVGPTSAHALMEAIGMIDTHVAGSWRRGCSGLWGWGRPSPGPRATPASRPTPSRGRGGSTRRNRRPGRGPGGPGASPPTTRRTGDP